jgi:DNA ligase (NAD+)
MDKLIDKINNNDNVFEIIDNLNIEDLEKLINYASDKYYNTNEPVIEDAIYDLLIDYLKLKNPKSKILKNIGFNISNHKNKVELDYNLGSMNKVKYQSNQLNIWNKKFKNPYVLSDKLDGISSLLIYRNDKTINLYTRGTSTEGLDISKLIKYLNLPSYDTIKKICDKYNINGHQNLIALRGELIMNNKTFENKWSKEFKNSRNLIAGLVNSKKINPKIALDTDLIIYEIIDPYYKIIEQFELLKKLPFNYVNYKIIDNILNYDFLSNYLKSRKKESEYLIDGIIVSYGQNTIRHLDGNPDYSFAFKDVLDEQIKQTKIINIEWNISKNGLIIPTIIIESINIGGVSINRVSGHNARYIVDNNLNINSIVEVIRSGDVIPKIHNIIKCSNTPNLPDNIKWTWDKNKVNIVIDNFEDNRDVQIKNIYFFFNKLDIKGIGLKLIEKLYDNKFDTIIKIIELKYDDLINLDGIQDKKAHNILNAIKESINNVPLYKLMTASNKIGDHIGEERIKQILNIYPNIIQDFTNTSKKELYDNIINIDGWNDILTNVFINNFHNFINFYNDIKKYINIKQNKINISKLTNIIFVFTGFRNNELKNKIELLGGKVNDSISKNINYLVIKNKYILDEPTEKINKAIKLGINIITLDELIKMI